MERSRLIPILQSMVYGIYLLTSSHQGRNCAMIVSWVTQLSWDPLRMGVAIRKGRMAEGIIRLGRNFALHLIQNDAPMEVEWVRCVLETKSMEGSRWTVGVSGAPLLLNSMAVLDCKLNEEVDVGDHNLFIGDVLDGQFFKQGKALCSRDHGHNTYLGQK